MVSGKSSTLCCIPMLLPALPSRAAYILPSLTGVCKRVDVSLDDTWGPDRASIHGPFWLVLFPGLSCPQTARYPSWLPSSWVAILAVHELPAPPSPATYPPLSLPRARPPQNRSIQLPALGMGCPWYPNKGINQSAIDSPRRTDKPPGGKTTTTTFKRGSNWENV